ncbi:MAG: Radical domain heme biosynthesis protein [Acidobacteria bacterium]|nr:Radical domain heme biosynthesis protein [Acidobacteriota bacterium]
MAEIQENLQAGTDAAPFRIDAKLHQILYKTEERAKLQSKGEMLPEPVYPMKPNPVEMTERQYQKLNAIRTWKTWGAPYFKSRWHNKEVRPIIPFLFTEWKCNLDCHYCWSYNNAVKGMTEDTAKQSIDWLHSIGSRVLALMGGEPLLRPKFIHKIVSYSAKKDIFVYLPTNGRLMKPEVIDQLGDAGIATVNLAVDSVKERKSLPKAFEPIKPYFDYLVKRQRYYGYTVMFNINICHNNMDDVKELTEIAHASGIATDYHINETPMTEQDHFKHLTENQTYLTPEDWPKVDALLDYLNDKRVNEGYKMVNPIQHMQDMKLLMRGDVPPWQCRAGQNSLIIRTDGTLAPCFPMYSATHDWGVVGAHKFDTKQLDDMKVDCTKHCLSTCNYILGYCYDTLRVMTWAAKQAKNGFKGATGSF